MSLYTILSSSYQGKKVYVTGHTGFKGSWLVRVLQLLGAEVKGYALAPEYRNTLYHFYDFEHSILSEIGDILNKEQLHSSILTFQPDYVFHLAAQPLVRDSYDRPSYTFDVNAVGTANVLDAVRLLEKRCQVICITTDKVYENREWVHPYRETDELGGYDPYSASKAAAEIVIQSYRRSFFHPSKYNQHHKSISVARAGNVIGGGDWSTDRLVPDIMKAMFEQRPVVVRNPTAIRPWQHVLEPIMGYLLLGHQQSVDPIFYAQGYNFGPEIDDTLAVESLVQQVIAAWGSGSYEVHINPNAPHEAGILRLDISKAYLELGWKPKWKATDSIAKTVEWYKEHNGDIVALTDDQIKTYLEL